MNTLKYLLRIISCLIGFSLYAHIDNLLLKDYRLTSIDKTPSAIVKKAKFPVIDAHPYATTKAEIKEWVNNMNQIGIEKTILLTYATGDEFDSLYSVY